MRRAHLSACVLVLARVSTLGAATPAPDVGTHRFAAGSNSLASLKFAVAVDTVRLIGTRRAPRGIVATSRAPFGHRWGAGGPTRCNSGFWVSLRGATAPFSRRGPQFAPGTAPALAAIAWDEVPSTRNVVGAASGGEPMDHLGAIRACRCRSAPWPPPVSNDEPHSFHPERSVICRYRAFCGAADASCGRMSRQRAASGPNSVQFGFPGAVECRCRPGFATRSADCTRSRAFGGLA